MKIKFYSKFKLTEPKSEKSAKILVPDGHSIGRMNDPDSTTSPFR